MKRVKNLPAELRNQIYDLTFNDDATNHHIITASYRPPAVLQVNRATRHKFAASYYNKTFYVTHSGHGDPLCVTWLRSLPLASVVLLSRVVVHAAKDGEPYLYHMSAWGRVRLATQNLVTGRHIRSALLRLPLFHQAILQSVVFSCVYGELWQCNATGMTVTSGGLCELGAHKGASHTEV